MREARGQSRIIRRVQLACVAVAGLVLANCSGSSNIDPRYGVSSSPRVIEPGQPVPKGGGVYRVGKPYMVAGRVYVPEEDVNYRAEGMASWYGDDFHGRYTANGEIFDMNSISAAHPTLPIPSYVRVTNLKNRKSIVVRINDRGPYARDRLIDVSVRTAKLLGFYGHGLTKVRVEYIGRAPLAGSDDRKLEATLRDGTQPKRAAVQVASADTFAPAYFDPQPMSRTPAIRNLPMPPPSRPYAADNEAQTTEFAASRRPTAEPPQAGFAERYAIAAQAAEPAPSTRLASPVSAYAPARYDAPAPGFMSGRGLY